MEFKLKSLNYRQGKSLSNFFTEILTFTKVVKEWRNIPFFFTHSFGIHGKRLKTPVLKNRTTVGGLIITANLSGMKQGKA